MTTYKPLPGTMLVKPIATEETRPGGAIVLLDSTRERLLQLQAEVVEMGVPEACEDGDCELGHHWIDKGAYGVYGFGPHFRHHCYPPSLKVGAWILMEPRQLVETLTPGLFVLRMDAVTAVVVP